MNPQALKLRLDTFETGVDNNVLGNIISGFLSISNPLRMSLAQQYESSVIQQEIDSFLDSTNEISNILIFCNKEECDYLPLKRVDELIESLPKSKSVREAILITSKFFRVSLKKEMKRVKKQQKKHFKSVLQQQEEEDSKKMKQKSNQQTPRSCLAQTVSTHEASNTSSQSRKGLQGNSFPTTVIPEASSSTNQQILTLNASQALKRNIFSQDVSREYNEIINADSQSAIQSLAHSQAETKDILSSIMKTLSTMQQDILIIKQDNKENSGNVRCLYELMVAQEFKKDDPK